MIWENCGMNGAALTPIISFSACVSLSTSSVKAAGEE